MRILSALTFLVAFNVVVTSSTEKKNTTVSLALVQVIFRHGDRTPLFDFPNNTVNISEKWPSFEELGQLTDMGREQAKKLGEFLRSRYGKFIQEHFRPREIYAISSTTHRTLFTGIGVLFGLYPNGPYAPFTIPHKMDNKIGFGKDCYNYRAELDYFMKFGGGKKIDDKYRDLYQYISNNTGVPLDKMNFDTVGSIYDTLFVQKTHGVPLPEWSTKPFYKNETFVMRSIAEFGFSALTNTSLMMRLRASPIFSHLIENMEDQKLQKFANTRKIMLFSGHDTTVSTILQALDVYDGRLVQYTGSILIELYKESVQEGSCSPCPCTPVAPANFSVKVFYRNCLSGEPVELFVPDCGTPCYLDKLKELKSNFLMGEGQWTEECGPQLVESKGFKYQIPFNYYNYCCSCWSSFTHPFITIWHWIISMFNSIDLSWLSSISCGTATGNSSSGNISEVSK